MNALRSVALLLAALVPLSASAQQQRRKVSLHEALQLAARQGPDVAAARAQAAIVHASVNKAWTAWQPDLTANGTYDHTNGFATLDFSALGTILGNTCTSFPVLCAGVDTSQLGALKGKTTIVAQNNWY